MTTTELVGVMGGIGAGKTTLIQDAAKTGLAAAYVEYANGPQLARYLKRPLRHAFAFQSSMMTGAMVRTQCALAQWQDPACPKLLLVERPLLENIIFARANYDTGRMSDAQWRLYKQDVAAFAQDEASFGPPRMQYVYLHAEEGELLRRVGVRARAGELSYSGQKERDPEPGVPEEKERNDHYWEHLANLYCLAMLEMTLRAQGHMSPGRWRVPVPRVLLWEPFGTFETLLAGRLKPPCVLVPLLDETGADWSLAAYMQATEYGAHVANDEARTMRHALMTKMGTEKSITVYLGQGGDMLLDLYS